MSKNFALFTLFILLLPLAIQNQNKSKPAAAKWEKTSYTEKQDANFSEDYHWGVCRVTIRRDGTGLVLSAYDETWTDGTLVETILLTAKNGKTSEKVSMTVGVMELNYLPVNDGYEVFRTKCGQSLDTLPEKVKQLLGSYKP